MKLFCLILLANISLTLCELTIVTYNLWNIMFNWEVRKNRISKLIRESAADVVAFQEVRQNEETGRNQIHDLQDLLPWYRYQAFAAANTVQFPPGTIDKSWATEGVGVMSQYPISEQHQQLLTSGWGPDTNKRTALHVILEKTPVSSVLVSVLHLSTDKKQQCQHVLQVLHKLAEFPQKKSLVVGDFNTYADFEAPLQLFTESQRENNPASSCHSALASLGMTDTLGQFTDAWKDAGLGEPGLTFSNMPTPGLESRPDRVLVRQLSVTGASLSGNGNRYSSWYRGTIRQSRMYSVIRAMSQAYSGVSGRSCAYDCGPHASCRCGVCVSGGNQHECLLPDCPECDGNQHKKLAFVTGIGILIIMNLIHALARVLYWLNHRSYKSVVNIAGLSKLCVCDERLYTTFPTRPSICGSVYSRCVTKCCPWLGLPPMWLLLLCVITSVIYYCICLQLFSAALQDIDSIIPEELFPSDHMMLTVKVKLKDTS